MRRRELILVLAGAMTAGRTLRAQQKAMPVIGFPSAFFSLQRAPPSGAIYSIDRKNTTIHLSIPVRLSLETK
jgi:hypothetical protein